jgi:hypothetical protein
MLRNLLSFAVLLLALTTPPAFAHQDTPGMIGEHDMMGTVQGLDPKTGTFMLKTASGMMLHLHFPPPALKDVKDGDMITVHLGFTKGAPGK